MLTAHYYTLELKVVLQLTDNRSFEDLHNSVE